MNKKAKKFKFDRKFLTRVMCIILVVLMAAPYLIDALIP